ncbi:lymphocyte antigen 6L-like [Myotis myotis]|uniref:UPAR/Ly6 domain-containing protein n=1 Tax=Myotis myotis TaxID=51298 RepID=A0A7J7TJD2_MYOMY|nr:lymphocyte antigen 6L-like [Myotis myotis]KAF6300530.1 hypothetical protein mMyoMyo1_009015 [Myotis myotis]
MPSSGRGQVETGPDCPAMRGFLLLLWAALVGATKEGHLQCSHCLATNSTSACKPVMCTPPNILCFSHEVIFTWGSEQRTRVTRGCTSTCAFKSPPEWDLLTPNMVVLAKALCCSKSLCNTGAPGGLSARTWHRGLLLGMGLGLHHLL